MASITALAVTLPPGSWPVTGSSVSTPLFSTAWACSAEYVVWFQTSVLAASWMSALPACSNAEPGF